MIATESNAISECLYFTTKYNNCALYLDAKQNKTDSLGEHVKSRCVCEQRTISFIFQR